MYLVQWHAYHLFLVCWHASRVPSTVSRGHRYIRIWRLKSPIEGASQRVHEDVRKHSQTYSDCGAILVAYLPYLPYLPYLRAFSPRHDVLPPYLSQTKRFTDGIGEAITQVSHAPHQHPTHGYATASQPQPIITHRPRHRPGHPCMSCPATTVTRTQRHLPTMIAACRLRAESSRVPCALST